MKLTAKLPESSVSILSGVLREMMKMSRLVEEFQVVDLAAVEDHHLKLIGRDVGVKLWISVPAGVSGAGAVTVDIAKLTSVLSAAAGGEIKLAAKKDKGCLVQAPSAKWRLQLRESLPVDESDMQLNQIGVRSLRPVSEQLMYAVSVMPASATSVAAEHYRTCALQDGKIYGTDGVTAVMRVLPKEFGQLSWVLSRRAAEFVIRTGKVTNDCNFSLVDQGTSVKLCCTSEHFTAVFVFTKPSQPLKPEQIKGTLAADLAAVFSAQRDDMLSMIRLTEPTNSDETRAVNLKVGDTTLLMNTKDTTGASQAKLDGIEATPGTKPAKFSDEQPILLRANADRLAKCLAMLDTGKVHVGIPPGGKYLSMWDATLNYSLLALMAGSSSG